MKLYYVYRIDWAVVGRSRVKRDACAEALNLPSRAYVYAPSEDTIASILLARYGWGVKDFNADEYHGHKVFPAD